MVIGAVPGCSRGSLTCCVLCGALCSFVVSRRLCRVRRLAKKDTVRGNGGRGGGDGAAVGRGRVFQFRNGRCLGRWQLSILLH